MLQFTHLALIVAMDLQGGIGRNNQLLCHIPEDLAYFKQQTWGGTLIMGRRTYESIGRPLPGRKNVVLSKQEDLNLPPNVTLIHTPEEVANLPQEHLFIAGGATIYKLFYPYVTDFFLTRIDANLDADTFFPVTMPNPEWNLLNASGWQTSVKGLRFQFEHYARKKI